eukprot:2325130-Amphidinium_carterae.1
MDAWLDTVDQAEKTAAFQRLDTSESATNAKPVVLAVRRVFAEERLEKAKELAESRLAALSKNLGKDEGDPL